MQNLAKSLFVYCLWAYFVAASNAIGQTKSVLYTFPTYSQGGASTFETPDGLVADKQGNLYGVTVGGSVSCQAGCGQVFELVSPGSPYGQWALRVIYQFTGGSDDGCYPYGRLAIKGHNLYGVTEGTPYCNQPSTVFELKSTSDGGWTYHTIGYDSLSPPVALDADGNVYGIPDSYESPDYGYAVEWEKPAKANEPWNKILLTPVSEYVNSGLTYYQGGLYGTTGGYGSGSVFELSQTNGQWAANEIMSFEANPTEGNGYIYLPSISIDKSGDIFGVTQYQVGGCSPGQICGTVFELQKEGDGTWEQTTVHEFNPTDDGTNDDLPVSVTVMPDGKHVFGSTNQGEVSNVPVGGIVFHLAAPVKAGASWMFDSLNLGNSEAFGNVILDDDRLGVYLSAAPNLLENVDNLVSVGEPYEPAGDTGTAPCISFSYPAAGQVQFTNSCTNRVDYWQCAENTAAGYNTCDPIIDYSTYTPSYLDGGRSITLNVSLEPGLTVVGNALECKAHRYPVLYTDAQGNEHLDCGAPVN